MTGGLLNIIAYGNQNIILNGNPNKTFFKSVYSKYTNFGLQKYRIDYKGYQNLQASQTSTFTFKIPRYAELLMDTFLVITIPDIWSSFYDNNYNTPYKFNWVKYLGTTMIESVVLSSSGSILQQFTGDYIKNSLERNLSQSKKEHFYKMIGHEKSIYSPQEYYGNNGYYPNVINNNSQPSIRGRKLYIPLPFWFSNSSKSAFPLTCLQYDELEIKITLKPIKNLFTILKYNSVDYSRISPNFINRNQQIFNFIQQQTDNMDQNLVDWKTDIHLISTYAFLSEEEIKVFTKNEQLYLIKEVYQENYLNIIGNKRIKINTNHLVSNWFWFLRRSDVGERNEWNNYSNWEYEDIPNVLPISNNMNNEIVVGLPQLSNVNNLRSILQKVSINIDGKYRESEFDAEVYNYIEKYNRCNGVSDDGLYSYSFSINTDPFELQPSGAMNLNRFKNIFIDILTITPEKNPDANVISQCDSEGNIIGVIDVDPNKLFKYSYDFILFEERFNIVKIMSGTVGLIYSR
tara:strand:+ start:5645 stop:7192 length:1548 start_codon:yes stop_codon:yes gene_type:complete